MTSFGVVCAYQLYGESYLLHMQDKSHFYPDGLGNRFLGMFNHLRTKTNLFYLKTQSVPSGKHFSP